MNLSNREVRGIFQRAGGLEVKSCLGNDKYHLTVVIFIYHILPGFKDKHNI